MKPSNDDTVRALLAGAGIQPPEEEIETMIESYPTLRAAADALYNEDAARYLPAFYPTDDDLEAK
jgi:hypothetical protein